jgi:hypothetical protein
MCLVDDGLASSQLYQNGGGGGDRAGTRPGRNQYTLCVVASCLIPRYWLGLLELVGDFMQTLHPREKVCIVSACKIFADVQTFQMSAECANCRLFEKMSAKIAKSLQKSAQSLQSLHVFYIQSAYEP